MKKANVLGLGNQNSVRSLQGKLVQVYRFHQILKILPERYFSKTYLNTTKINIIPEFIKYLFPNREYKNKLHKIELMIIMIFFINIVSDLILLNIKKITIQLVMQLGKIHTHTI